MQQTQDRDLVMETKRYELEIEKLRRDNLVKQREIEFAQKKNRA